MIEEIFPKIPIKEQHDLGIVKRNGQHLLRIVNQLLDLTKLENKAFELKLQKSNIIEYLRFLTESLTAFANSRNISLRFMTTVKDLEMDFSVDAIQEIVTNLLSNALKFTPNEGDIIVEINEDEPKNALLISVRDTGIGISETDLPHIFDRFYQAQHENHTINLGTGIGLSHTLELVKLMNGDINVASEVGKGTVFTVSLPILYSDKKITELNLRPIILNEIAVPNSLQEENIAESDLLKILIIEDNPDVAHYIKNILSPKYSVNIAYNGRIGIEMALAKIPDIILSDVVMPEKNGYEVIDALKNDSITSHIPIILLTAKTDIQSKIDGLKRGADAYLSKPFNKEELLVTISMIIDNKNRLSTYFSTKYVSLEEHKTFDLSELKLENVKIEDAFLQKIREIVAANYDDENFSLPMLCQKMRLSRFQLNRKMKALTEESPSLFIRNYRLQKANELLKTTDNSVKEIAFMVGFKDVPHFTRSYQELFKKSPSATNK
jgi:DNA-binding response OmpR family regulator